ncbi:hypothetical protein ANCCAN_08224 [Ancylostoma caninum]|uniref:Uncharacterized protein n=1 Tax=Ancylostoma caninum TaxID=29170 RepID=A0A368GN69_ANCCA|nr:hypothetical protein ANCCAN_08224 [Ancylostoma caninum]
MSVPGLRNALVKVLRDYAARVELQRGCQGATRGDVRDLLTFHLQSKALSVIVTSETNCSMCGKNSILCPGTHSAELRTFGCGHVAHLSCCLEAERRLLLEPGTCTACSEATRDEAFS